MLLITPCAGGADPQRWPIIQKLTFNPRERCKGTTARLHGGYLDWNISEEIKRKPPEGKISRNSASCGYHGDENSILNVRLTKKKKEIVKNQNKELENEIFYQLTARQIVVVTIP